MNSLENKTLEYQLYGHDQLLEQAFSLVQNSRFPPVVLFHGRPGIGKKVILKKIAKIALCETKSGCGECSSCRRVGAESHPNLFVLDSEAKQLKLDDAKEIQEHLSIAAGEGNSRVVIISDAERLNVQAVNRLLKTFEEPPEGAVILMSTSSLKAILDTLLSRSIKWLVRPPNFADFKKIIADYNLKNGHNGLSDSQYVRLSRRSGYSPGKAIELLESELDAGPIDLKVVFDKSVHASKSLDTVSQFTKSNKLTPKQVIAELEEQLNTYYRNNIDKLDSLALKQLAARRKVLSEIRRATITNETAFNVPLILEAVAVSS